VASTLFKEFDLKNSILPNDWLENNIKAITEDATVKNFPHDLPSTAWAGNVIDLLAFLVLAIYSFVYIVTYFAKNQLFSKSYFA
jgi:hypothetical protein